MVDRGEPDGHTATVRVPEEAYAIRIHVWTTCEVINTYGGIVQGLCKKRLTPYQA